MNMERKLTAILSADVKGYSRLIGEDEEATIRTLTAYREEMVAIIRQHRGRVVDSPGDNFSLEGARQRWPYKDPARLGHFLAALRKAGLK